MVPSIMMRLAAVAALALALAACGDDPEEAAPVVRPVKTVVVGGGEGGGLRNFPARIESSRRADLSFRVPGKVQEIPVREGERIEVGTVIARLDPSDYQLRVNDRQATFDRTEKDFARAAELIKRGFIPRQQYDRLEADMKSARAALDQSRRDLGYTELKAPFTGEISLRYVEAFEDVQAKQPVMAMRDVQSLEVKFDVPEQIIIRIDQAEQDSDLPEPDVLVSFASAPDNWYPLTFKEMAAQADRATQTFEVSYLMATPPDLSVLPGMTANVTVDLGAHLEGPQVVYVPVDAIVGSNDLSARVWVVDEATMTVAPQPVEVGAMRTGLIAITGGLEPGDRIVIAGVPFLVEGQEVTLALAVEQATERLDDVEIRRAAEKEISERPPAEETDN